MDRSKIVAEAREWLGTRWQHQASLKNVGCDCAGLVRGVYRELTGVDVDIEIDYPATWHLFKQEPRMYNTLLAHTVEIPLAEALPGDVITFAFRENFVDHHVGILTDSGTFIHAYLDVKKVVETRMDDTWTARRRHAFRYPGVE